MPDRSALGAACDGRVSDRLSFSAEQRDGRVLARGVCRHLHQHDFATIEEFVPCRGLRVDVFAIGPKGETWIVECKSTNADFTSDRKWRGYLDYCDRFFWAVNPAFPAEILPPDYGLIVTDGFEAEIIRWGMERLVSPARRKMLLLKCARTAMKRMQRHIQNA